MKKIIEFIALKPILFGAIIIVIVVAVILGVKYTGNSSEQNLSNMEYRNDGQPIQDRFKAIPEFQSCYWKASTIGRTDFGPTNYWMQGFIILEKTAFSKLLDEYSWEAVDIEFPKGIDPKVTNFDGFNWCYNEEFDWKVKTLSFVGNFYLDTNNGILYFSVENN
jgi:hypothetical protein